MPGYVDETEIDLILDYVKQTLTPSTPIVFLAFHGSFLRNDLPPTSFNHIRKALGLAKNKGFKKVLIGNEWLLGDYY